MPNPHAEQREKIADGIRGLLTYVEGPRLMEEGRAASMEITRMPIRSAVRKAHEALALIDHLEANEGDGWVYHNEDSGEEYSPNHPIESGEVPDATNIRRSTPQEDHLYAEYQREWQRANAAEQSLIDQLEADGGAEAMKERCAEVADQRWVGLRGIGPVGRAQVNEARHIAAAIRAIPAPATGEGDERG